MPLYKPFYLLFCKSQSFPNILMCQSVIFEFKYLFFVILNVFITSGHKNSSYGSLFYSTIGGPFFLLSVFTGPVHYSYTSLK